MLINFGFLFVIINRHCPILRILFVLSNYFLSFLCRTFQDGLWSKWNRCWYWNTCCHASTRCWWKLEKSHTKQFSRYISLSLWICIYSFVISMAFICHSKIWNNYFIFWFFIWLFFAFLHVCPLSSVGAVVFSIASIGWCCRSVFMAYGCWYHSLCFLLVCLVSKRVCHWAGEAIKGYWFLFIPILRIFPYTRQILLVIDGIHKLTKTHGLFKKMKCLCFLQTSCRGGFLNKSYSLFWNELILFFVNELPSQIK